MKTRYMSASGGGAFVKDDKVIIIFLGTVIKLLQPHSGMRKLQPL